MCALGVRVFVFLPPTVRRGRVARPQRTPPGVAKITGVAKVTGVTKVIGVAARCQATPSQATKHADNKQTISSQTTGQISTTASSQTTRSQTDNTQQPTNKTTINSKQINNGRRVAYRCSGLGADGSSLGSALLVRRDRRGRQPPAYPACSSTAKERRCLREERHCFCAPHLPARG